MAKKSRTDIMEKLSALKPSEPTKTRGKSSRKPTARKVRVKAAAAAKTPKPQAPPKSDIPSPGFAGFGVFGDPAKMYMGVYERWFKMITDTNSVLSNYNNMFVNSLTSLWDLSKWRRF
jgi:hypothetical protein